MKFNKTVLTVIKSRSQARKVQKSLTAKGLVATGSDLKRVSGWSVDVVPVYRKPSVRRLQILSVRDGVLV